MKSIWMQLQTHLHVDGVKVINVVIIKCKLDQQMNLRQHSYPVYHVEIDGNANSNSMCKIYKTIKKILK